MIESKVKWATVGTFVAGLLVAVFTVVRDAPELLEPVHPLLRALLVALAPALVTFLSGYLAPHTSRPSESLPSGQHRG